MWLYIEEYKIPSICVCMMWHKHCSFGYPNYLHVVEFPNVKCMWADVMCQYWPWAVSHSPEKALRVSPCLSVMHSCAHSWHCQVCYVQVLMCICVLQLILHACRYYGMVDGSMELREDQERRLSCSLAICQGSTLQQNIWMLLVCVLWYCVTCSISLI